MTFIFSSKNYHGFLWNPLTHLMLKSFEAIFYDILFNFYYWKSPIWLLRLSAMYLELKFLSQKLFPFARPPCWFELGSWWPGGYGSADRICIQIRLKYLGIGAKT